MMNTTYKALNHTKPNETEACWLCYSTKPPFYESVAIVGNYSTANNSDTCNWGQRRPGLTLPALTGNGTCIGTVPTKYSHLCINNRNIFNTSENWIIPPNNSWWLCSHAGLTPCLYKDMFNQSEFCVMVIVFPKIIYHTTECIDQMWIAPKRVTKRALITAGALTLATIFGLGAIGTGTGISALTIQNKGFSILREAVDKDIERIETTITSLEKSLTSLSEVVLQNRRGLDLLFLQQGGLCAALGEECCFYADHTGIVRDSMAKVREGPNKRKKEREQEAGWFESWFSASPWLTTLLSTLLGPLAILLLTLTLGLCIIKKIINFVQNRFNAVQLMVLRTQYQPLETLQIEN